MNLDDLKPAWKKQQRQLDVERVDALAELVRSKGQWLDKVLFRRDFVESAVGVLVIVLFGPSFFSAPLLGKIGVALIVFAAIEIIIVLNVTRAWRPPGQHDNSLGEFAQQRVSQVDRQIFLLQNVNWWYSGPILVGCALISFGRDPWGLAVAQCGFLLLFGWFIYWLNQRAVRTQLLPLRAEIAAAVDTFHSLNGDSTDDNS